MAEPDSGGIPSSVSKSVEAPKPNEPFKVGYRGLGAARYGLLICATLAQLATIIITWELWQPRVDPPNLPLLDFLAPHQISFSILLLLSLLLITIVPRTGFWVHVIVLLIASVFDQFRMQPQLLAIVVLMWATLYPLGRPVTRWFLASLWLWAGLHKLLSPHWFAHASYWMLVDMGMTEPLADHWHWGTRYRLLVENSRLGQAQFCGRSGRRFHV